MNRRDVIKSGVLAGVAGALASQTAQAQSNSPSFTKKARNVVMFVIDGLGWDDYAIAQFYSRRFLGRPLALERLLTTSPNGLQNTNSLTSFVTESSAAANAWSTGVKTVNGGLAIHIDGRKLTPIFESAKQIGKAVGLVTSATVTHATPAAFVVSNKNRNAEEEIAQQYLDFGADVYLGGGDRFFNPEIRSDKKDMYAAYAARGYGVVKTKADLMSNNSSKLLGVFSRSHVPYEADRRFQNVDAPSLADMTKKALAILAAKSSGFVLQVEAARVDHAGHLNDPAALMWDLIAADEALQVVMNFVDANPDTLLIVGSDHACGNGALYGTGPSYRNSSIGLDLLDKQKGTIEFILGRLGANPSVEQVSEIYRTVKAIELKQDQAQAVVDAITKKVYLPDSVRYSIQPSNTLAWVMRQTSVPTPDRPNIGFHSGQHTGQPTLFAVYGKDLGVGRIGLVDNTYLYTVMARALGIRTKNPVMSEEEALAILAAQAQRTAASTEIFHPHDIVG
ncbi:MAG: alkaline phosphatase [Deinococcales bacterium]